MKKILPLMVLLCLFGSFAVPISANDEDPGLTTMIDVERDSCPDDLVMPEEWGEVVILANPEIELYEDEIQKDPDDMERPENLVSPGEDGEVVIMENPEGGDMDGDGVPDDRDECPTVPGDAWNGCPTDENGNIEKVIGITDDINTGEGTGFPVTIVSVVAGIILGAIVVIGMTVRRKK